MCVMFPIKEHSVEVTGATMAQESIDEAHFVPLTWVPVFLCLRTKGITLEHEERYHYDPDSKAGWRMEGPRQISSFSYS